MHQRVAGIGFSVDASIRIALVDRAVSSSMRSLEHLLRTCARPAFALECPACAGDIRIIAFITDPAPIRKILTYLGEPLEPPPLEPARGPPTSWAELGQVHDDRDAIQASPEDLPVIDIRSL